MSDCLLSPLISHSQQQQQQQQHDDPFDFHPKNNNWGHFERHGEDDIKNGTVCLSEEEDDGSSSSSSNEGFLWTNASRKQQRKLDSIPKGHSEGTKGASPTLIPRSSSSQPANEKTRELSFEELPGPLSSLAGLASTAPPNNQKTNDGVNNTNHLNGPMSPASPFASLDPVPEAEAPSGYAGDEPDAHLQRQPMLPNSLPQIPRPTKRATRSQSNPERTIKRQFTIGQTGVSNGSTCDARNPAEESHGSVRALYNAQIMPNKVVMVRHGQSEGNINEALYSTTPDNAMRITRLGWEQARRAGEILKEQIIASGETVHFIVSPYVRTVETFHGIASAWCDPKEFDYIPDREKRIKAWYGRLLELGLTWHEDPRIREQDFGNYQIPEKIKAYKRERHQFGPFFYRFPHGESASDVFDRVSTFLDSLWRSFDLNKSRNYVLITHGISIRVLLARYFRYSIEQFNRLANPRNCEMVMLRHDGAGKLQLDGRCELELEKDGDSGETTVTGHEFRRRLRILPRQYIRTLHVRIGPDDDVPANCFPIPLNASTDTAS